MISLLTDFGTSEPYSGIMKGAILSVNPDVTIVDITHDVEPQDIRCASYFIYAAYQFFPLKTIHVIVVDPGVGSDRSILAVCMGGHYFLAPDNGVLDLIFGENEIEKIVKVENKNYFLKPVSRTFHGRDIFAPVAAHMSKGVGIETLGPEISFNDTVRLGLLKPYRSENGELIGQVIFEDRFGNLVTNIDRTLLFQAFDNGDTDHMKLTVENNEIKGLSESYADVEPGSLLAVIGSMGFVEISVNQGRASEVCGARKDSIVKISK